MREKRSILTTRQSHPVSDNQSLRSAGERGPATLENYHFAETAGIDLEKGKALEPLPGKPAPHQSRPGCTYAGGEPEEAAARARAQVARGR